MKQGALIVVGTGIGLAGQCSIEAKRAIEGADIVFCQLGDDLAEQWLASINPNIVSLTRFYEGRSRLDAYDAMATAIIEPLERGADVCAVFYGHPGVFVRPSHEAMRRARARGFDARMLPAISAEDCLFADLGIDPALNGAQSFEARDFLLNERKFDETAPLILWQPAVLGDDTFTSFIADARATRVLAAALMETYPADHEVVLYEAAALPIASPRMERARLSNLHRLVMSQTTTLYVPPFGAPQRSRRRQKLLEAHLSPLC